MNDREATEMGATVHTIAELRLARACSGIEQGFKDKREEITAALVALGFPLDYAKVAASDLADDWINAQLTQWNAPLWHCPGWIGGEVDDEL